MKFRKLKHKTWLAQFDCFILGGEDYYNVNISCLNGILYATFEWEYDNGLYVETGNKPFQITWKSIKQNMSYVKWNGKKEEYWVEFYKGKCSKCGNKISEEDFVKNGTSICYNCLNDWSLDEI